MGVVRRKIEDVYASRSLLLIYDNAHPQTQRGKPAL